MSDVFDPEHDGISDTEWQELVARASGGRFFSENQVFIAHAQHKVRVRRYIARRGVFGLLLIPVGLAAWVYALGADWGLTLVAGIVVTLTGVACVGTGVVTEREPASREPVQRWLAKWKAQRGLDKLIDDQQRAPSEDPIASPNGLIVVERDALADLLLANGAQRELDALIVSESGYPAALGEAAQRFLAEHSDARVLALHDATAHGVSMPARLSKSATLPLAGRTIVDVGLFPADVTWLAELAPAIPASHTTSVPVDSLSYATLLVGLRGALAGELSLHAAIETANG